MDTETKIKKTGKLTYVAVKGGDEDLQRILDHFSLGKLEKVLGVYTTLICKDIIPLFFCKTSRGKFLVIKVDTRISALYAKSKIVIKILEQDLKLKNPKVTNNSNDLNFSPAHVGNYYFFVYPCGENCNSVFMN